MNEEEFHKSVQAHLDAIEVWKAEIKTYEDKAKLAKKKLSDLFAEFQKFLTPQNTVFHNGRWYVVKIMKNKMNYMLTYDKEPASWDQRRKKLQDEFDAKNNSQD